MKKIYRDWYISRTKIPGMYTAAKGNETITGTEAEIRRTIDEKILQELRNEENKKMADK